MPKSTKRFIISNSGLNGQGFRMLTEGVVLDDFNNNPLMLFNHQRPTGSDKNQILPIGHWEDIEVNGDDLSAVPVFDDKDEFAMSIYNKVEAGHIRMCSAGAEPLETSDDEADLLPGQTKATVTQWRLKEASIVDIGANPGALSVALYDSNDNLIKLSDSSFSNLIPTIMNKKTTTAKAAAAKAAAAEAAKAEKAAKVAKEKAIKLADEAKNENGDSAGDGTEEEEEEQPEAQLSDNTDEDKDATIADLTQKLAEATKELTALKEKLALAEGDSADKKCEQLADKAIAQRRISLGQRAHIIKLAKSDYNGTVEYLNTLKASPTIKELAAEGGNNQSKSADAKKLETLSGKNWDELFNETGTLDFLKLNAPDVYKTKFKEKFGKDPKNA